MITRFQNNIFIPSHSNFNLNSNYKISAPVWFLTSCVYELCVTDCGSGQGRNKLKILTYNVWSNECLEVKKRMEAVGELIKLHSPDVICFQLSKLPVKVAEIEVPKGKPLIVATSHLESHIGTLYTSGRESRRMKQAKAALKILERDLNVVFGSDMNWDDELDGQCPLSGGWSDAWPEQRPGENGWTYDTKSNLMLCANKHTLQERLDRSVCKLHDYKMCEIEMIGMNAIPGLSYRKKNYVKKEYKWCKRSELPILPSDPYGLLLAICSQ